MQQNDHSTELKFTAVLAFVKTPVTAVSTILLFAFVIVTAFYQTLLTALVAKVLTGLDKR